MTDDIEQLDLLQTGKIDGCESTPTAVFPAARVESRGPGRPKGAINKKTEAIGKLYQSKGFRDPLLFQGEILSSHPLDLHHWFVVMQAKTQGIEADKAQEAYRAGTLNGVPSIAEIVAMQTKVADQVTPYMYGKKPLQTENNDERLPMLFIDLGDGSQSGVDQANEDSLSIGQALEDQSQQNQSLSDNESSMSHGSMSHEVAKSLKDKGE
ncbi:hypothetical protein SAMN04515647_3816 [Cohaesibacter sp. ES.047]|uniref:hypothetical protein n=1 Tax=Cohaesibacter sp. ES.047 TaxID=1798205 RepID=UPI000BB9B731|nr:hypothetical protein [Cohaesibacter sp. ES.047]SNY93517.1 hypothetical protein SAMN04515647_3816 [Cohaesibacter sp. ES.047]